MLQSTSGTAGYTLPQQHGSCMDSMVQIPQKENTCDAHIVAQINAITLTSSSVLWLYALFPSGYRSDPSDVAAVI